MGAREEKHELVQGTLDMLILKTLVGDRMHGYAVARRIQQTSDGLLKVEEGSLYPALHRMERRGWIASEWGVSESNRRAKYYALTAAGRNALEAEVASWKRFAEAVAAVLGARPAEA